MRSKYLEELGVPSNELSWNLCTEDKRNNKEWKKQREELGFDDRDTWNLDWTLICLIYPRLKQYLKVASNLVDLDYHKVTYGEDNKEYTERQIIEMILEIFESHIKERDNIDYVYDKKKMQEAFSLLGLILPALWW